VKEKSCLFAGYLPIERSRWIATAVVCDNGAVAHSTPVYVKVNNRPTWCPKRGPLVVQKQLVEIGKIECELAGRTDDTSVQIRQRLEQARKYYAGLSARMAE